MEEVVRRTCSQPISFQKKLDSTLATKLASHVLQKSCEHTAGVVDVIRNSVSLLGCEHAFSVRAGKCRDSSKHVFESSIRLRPSLEKDTRPCLRVTLTLQYETRFSRCGTARIREKPDILSQVRCSFHEEEDSESKGQQLFDFNASLEMRLRASQGAVTQGLMKEFLADYELDYDYPDAAEQLGLFWEVFDRRFTARLLPRLNSSLGALNAVNPEALSTLLTHLGLCSTDAAGTLRAIILALLAPGLQPQCSPHLASLPQEAVPVWALWQMLGDMDDEGMNPLAHLLTFLKSEGEFFVSEGCDS
jgi:hypothetical protein